MVASYGKGIYCIAFLQPHPLYPPQLGDEDIAQLGRKLEWVLIFENEQAGWNPIAIYNGPSDFRAAAPGLQDS